MSQDETATPACEDLTAFLDALSARLDNLEGRGGKRFDAPGCRCVRALIERADTLENRHLARRAEAKLTALEAGYDRGLAAAGAALDDLSVAGTPGTKPIRETLRRGDVTGARQGIRRLRALPPRVVAGQGGASEERYRRASAELSTAITLARARADLPGDAGPYNAALVATRTLDRLAETSPTYLHSLVERLEDLAELQSVVPPPEAPKAKDRARQKSSGPGARSSSRQRKTARGKRGGPARGRAAPAKSRARGA